MPYPRPTTVLALAAALTLPLPAGALAQDTNVGPDGNPLPGLPQEPLDNSTGGGTAVDPAATTPPPATTTPDVEATTPPATAPAPAAPGASQPDTPVPPPYLIPGPSAQQQPVSRVAALTEPAVPAEPLRLATLAAALLAVLLVALTALLRALGVRTPVVDPVQASAGGRLSRVGERLRGTADDMRDFLRRSR